MANLGVFGAAIRELDPDAERDTFVFFGETFVIHGTVPGIVELHISAALAGKTGAVEGDAALFEALRHALTIPSAEEGGRPDRSQWERFYALAIERRAEGGSLTSLALSIMGAQVGRPTERPSTSSDGPPQTSTSSSSPSSASPDAPTLRPVDEVLAG